MSAFNTTYYGAVAPPPGVVPDLENPRQGGAGRTANVAVLTVSVVLVTVMLAIRTWVKIRITRTILVEDGTCVLAWVGIVLYAATCFMNAQGAHGQRCWNRHRENADRWQWLYASSIIYCPAAYFTKITLLLLIARVFKVKTCVAYGIYTFIAVVLVAYLPIQTLKIIICLPIRAYWDRSVEGHCFNQPRLFLSDLSIAVLTDLVILVVPIILSWRLHFGWRKKVKISFLLGAGGIATGVTVFRIYLAVKFIKSKDVAADFVLLDILTITEITIGLVCACLPAVNILTAQYHISCFPHSSWADSNTLSEENRIRHIRWFRDTPQTPADSGKSWTFKLPQRHSAPAAADKTLGSPKWANLNFESELAMFSGAEAVHPLARPDAVALEAQSPMILDDQEHWFTVDRVNSRDGRREGWLRQSGQIQGNTIMEEDDSSQLSQATEISRELARVSGNRPWSRIWDGRCNSIS